MEESSLTQKISKQIVVGLQGTGKTTFLAALWYVVESGELSNSLQLDKLEGNREYINSLTEGWLSYKTLPRTTQWTPQIISMKLKEHGQENPIEIVFPDVSGESFESQWRDRKMEKRYAEFVREANGILLFLHPEKINKPKSIDLLNDMTGIDSNVTDVENSKPWTPEDAPTQVILVDLLQFVLSLTIFQRIKLAIIISAWDSLYSINQIPSQWFEKNLPLLYQYLQANSSLFCTKIFGVSAQGGDLEKDKIKLKQIDKPSERIKVIEEHQENHDITIPIRWLVGAI